MLELLCDVMREKKKSRLRTVDYLLFKLERKTKVFWTICFLFPPMINVNIVNILECKTATIDSKKKEKKRSLKSLLFHPLQSNTTPAQSFSIFFLFSMCFYSSVERTKKRRADMPPAHEHVDRLISLKRKCNDWLKNSIGRARMLSYTQCCMSGFFHIRKRKRRKKKKRASKREREKKRETERPQFLLPSAPHSSLLLLHYRQPTRRKIATAATEIQSLLIGHCISVKVLLSIGRRHDFKEVRESKAFSFLVRPISAYTQHNTTARQHAHW